MVVKPKLLHLWTQQKGRCFYCQRDTYLAGHGETRAEAKVRLGLGTERGSGSALRKLRATKEHLHRRVDGGGNAISNLVMACQWCNSTRGDRPVEEHKAAIAQTMSAPAQ